MPLLSIAYTVGNYAQSSNSRLGLLQILPQVWLRLTTLAMRLKCCYGLAFRSPLHAAVESYVSPNNTIHGDTNLVSHASERRL